MPKEAALIGNVQTIERAGLVSDVGTISASKMQLVCRALAVATGFAD